MTTSLAALSILALTVTVSLSRPRVRQVELHHSHAAVLGAVLCLVYGLVPVALALHALKVLLYPVITIVSLMVITLIADEAGLFEVLARRLVRAARGDGHRLFSHLFFTGTITGSVFTNDAAVLIFTPLVFRLIEEIRDPDWSEANRVAYYFGVLYVANLVGALVISNPINIIVATLFDIQFLEYAKWMFAPALVSVITSYAGLLVFFRRSIPRSFRAPCHAASISHDRRYILFCASILALTLVALFTESVTGMPTWLAALLSAVVLCSYRTMRGSRNFVSIARGIGWDVIIFVVGIFIVAYGLRASGVTGVIGHLLKPAAAASLFPLSLATGFVSAFCSAVMNNHPTANIMAMAIEDLSLPAAQSKLLALSALIGGDLGPKMLPIGSLAALLWFRLLRNRGVNVSYWTYIKVGVPVTLSAVLLSLLTLNAEFAIAGLF